MRVNADLVGRSYRADPYLVTAERLTEFARATGASHPVHSDADAARQAGHRGLIAPPTFAAIIAQRAEALYYADPECGVDFRYVVHAEEALEFHDTIVAGDLVDAVVTVESVVERGSLTFVTTRCALSAAGRPVAEAVSTLAVRGVEQ